MDKLIERCALRLARLRCVGWFDFSRGSYDMQLAEKHAYRIMQRRAR